MTEVSCGVVVGGGGGGVRLANAKPVEQADYSRLSNSMVTFEVTFSRYPRPGEGGGGGREGGGGRKGWGEVVSACS